MFESPLLITSSNIKCSIFLPEAKKWAPSPGPEHQMRERMVRYEEEEKEEEVFKLLT